MPKNILGEWLAIDERFTYKEWTAAHDRFLAGRVPEEEVLRDYVPEHPTFAVNHSVSERNWLRLLPAVTNDRFCEADDLFSVLSAVVDELYETITVGVNGQLTCVRDSIAEQSDDSPLTDTQRERGIKAYLGSMVASHFRGVVDIESVVAGGIEPPAAEPLADDFESTIAVHSINERLQEDIALFTVEPGFFGDRYGDSTLMLEQLLSSDRESDCLLTDVAFVCEGNPWTNTEPPRGPITAESIDHKSRASWVQINDPTDRYGGIWGDIDEMSEADFGKDDEVIFSERVDWRIITGLRCH